MGAMREISLFFNGLRVIKKIRDFLTAVLATSFSFLSEGFR